MDFRLQTGIVAINPRPVMRLTFVPPTQVEVVTRKVKRAAGEVGYALGLAVLMGVSIGSAIFTAISLTRVLL